MAADADGRDLCTAVGAAPDQRLCRAADAAPPVQRILLGNTAARIVCRIGLRLRADDGAVRRDDGGLHAARTKIISQ